MKKFNFHSKSPARLETTTMLSPPEKPVFSKSPVINSSAYYDTTPTRNMSMDQKSNRSRRELKFSNFEISPDSDFLIKSGLNGKNSPTGI